MPLTKRMSVYLILAIAGFAVTWYYNILFALEHKSFPLHTFISDNYLNPASASLTNDLFIVVAVFLVWSFRESRRIKMPRWWLYALLTFSVAAAFSFPFFLFMRERHLQTLEQPGTGAS